MLKNKFDYCSTQVDLPLDETVREYVNSKIPDKYVIDLPYNTHVTVLYGLECDYNTVKSLVEPFNRKLVITLGELDYFSKEDSDVLYARVISSDLRDLHDLVKKAPNAEEFRSYTPHMTVAYLKKGVASKLKGTKPFSGVFVVNNIVYSDKQGNKKSIQLTKDQPRKLILTDIVNVPRILQ